MRVLFVEDDTSQVQLFMDALNDWHNLNKDRQIQVFHAGNYGEAKRKLEELRLDAALFDLRLPPMSGGKSAAKNGNLIATESLRDVGIPVGIISGNPADIDPGIESLKLIQKFDKGDGDVYSKVVDWLASKWTMMTVLRSARQQIQASGADIFVKRLWPRWQTYQGLTGASEEELTRIVTRQYVGHVAEILGLDGVGNAPWHPYECFIHPALLDNRPHTGDLFRLDDGLWVILTPACDMATEKAKTVLLARVSEDSHPDWNSKIAGLRAEQVSNSTRAYFSRLVNQNVDASEHFLPPLKDGPPMMVKFKEVSTRSLEFLKSNLECRVASIASPFLPNLVQRFGAWISRTGQPNIEVRHFS